jgi:hypothetical protein
MPVRYYFNNEAERSWDLAWKLLFGWLTMCIYKGLRHRDTNIVAASFLFLLAVDGFTIEGRHP